MAKTAELEEQQQQQGDQKKPFDAITYINQRNEREQQQRAGKPAEPAAAAGGSGASEKPGEGSQPPAPFIPKAVRRELNKLREDAAELRGRLAAYEELGRVPPPAGDGKPAAATPAKDEDPKPVRKDFADDASFNEATSAWSGRQGAKTELEKGRQLQAIKDQIAAADQKAEKDMELFEDWDEKLEAAKDPDTWVDFNKDEEPDWEELFAGGETVGVNWNFKEHPLLLDLIARSNEKAAITYHLATTPQAMWDLLQSSATNQNTLITNFRQLEGEVRALYRKSGKTPASGGKGESQGTSSKDGNQPDQKGQAKAKPGSKETPPDRRLPKPSEAAAARGGSTPVNEISPYLADGKTVNPAWLEQRNQRSQSRR